MISPQHGNHTINPGAILVDKNALLPEPWRLESDATGSGWARVVNNLDGRQLEKELAAEGWTFFYMAGRIKATAFGFDRERMAHTALKRLVAKVRLQKCNCLEIDELATRSFLGMPYVSVSGHSRHIKKGLVFNDTNPGLSILGKERRAVERKMTGTPSQVEWAEQIKLRVSAEFDRVAQSFRSVTGRHNDAKRADTEAILEILEDKRAAVMSREEAGYFVHDWQEISDQVSQMIFHDPRYQAIKSNRAARQQCSVNSSLVGG